MVMKLYFVPDSCAVSAHIALRESKLPYELVQVTREYKLFEDGTDYFAINSLGTVPFLTLDDGFNIKEAPAILQFIADSQEKAEGKARLAPSNGTRERYTLQQWLNFFSSEIHKGFFSFKNFPSADHTHIKEQYKKLFTYVNKELEGRDYVLGENFSVADCYFFALVRWMTATWLDESIFNLPINLSCFKNIENWYNRVKVRPSVCETVLYEREAKKKVTVSGNNK